MAEAPGIAAGSIDRVEQIKVLSNATRMRILQVADEPVSARHLADRLGAPITRLYYHLDLLLEAGFLEVTDVRKSGAQLERLYRRTADHFEPTPTLVESLRSERGGAEMLAAVIVEPARLEVARLFEEGGTGDVTRSIVRMTPQMAEEYLERTKALLLDVIERSRDLPEEVENYAITHVFSPFDASSERG